LSLNWKKYDKDVWKSKVEAPKGKKRVLSNNKGKSNSQPPCNHDIKCFYCLEIGHIAFQCSNKRVMILRDNWEVEAKSDIDDKKMPPLEDDNDDEVEY